MKKLPEGIQSIFFTTVPMDVRYGLIIQFRRCQIDLGGMYAQGIRAIMARMPRDEQDAFIATLFLCDTVDEVTRQFELLILDWALGIDHE